MKVTGSCHCGEITYKAIVDPELVCICNCTDCQKLSGSAFRTVAITEFNQFELLTGALREYVKLGESGNPRIQSFCPNCGSPIYSVTKGEVNKRYGLRVGTINERSALIPKFQIWCQSSQSWLPDIDHLPKKQKQ